MLAISKRKFQSMIAVVKAMPRLINFLWVVYRLVIFATIGWGFVGVLTKLSKYGKNPLPGLGKTLGVDPFALSAARSLPYVLLTVCYVSWQVRRKAAAEEKRTWLWSTGQACRHIFLSRDPLHLACAFSAALSTALYSFAMLNSTGGFVSFIQSAYLVPIGLFSGTLLDHKLTKEDVTRD